MSISGKIVFTNDVEFTTTDVNSNKFLIYYRENDKLIKYSLPLNLIKEFTYIDEKEVKKCPICDSPNIIIPEPINSVEMNNDDIIHFDGINDWECLNCGANEVSLKMKEPEIIPQFKPLYMNRKRKEINEDNSGKGSFSHLRINGERYRNVLHWFRLPRGLLPIITDNNQITISTIPLFKYYERDWYIYLEYLWYIDGIQHKPSTSKHLVDDCRVSNKRYLKPPKDFNRLILKYKYPNIWNLIEGRFKWNVENNYVTLQIKWNKKKYYENLNGK